SALFPPVEMAVPWKSQNDSHRTLEIAHRTCDSHISTSRSLSRPQERTRTRGMDAMEQTAKEGLGHAKRAQGEETSQGEKISRIESGPFLLKADTSGV